MISLGVAERHRAGARAAADERVRRPAAPDVAEIATGLMF
jgi:hypothetical protein